MKSINKNVQSCEMMFLPAECNAALSSIVLREPEWSTSYLLNTFCQLNNINRVKHLIITIITKLFLKLL